MDNIEFLIRYKELKNNYNKKCIEILKIQQEYSDLMNEFKKENPNIDIYDLIEKSKSILKNNNDSNIGIVVTNKTQ
jgi:hypothetical protein